MTRQLSICAVVALVCTAAQAQTFPSQLQRLPSVETPSVDTLTGVAAPARPTPSVEEKPRPFFEFPEIVLRFQDPSHPVSLEGDVNSELNSELNSAGPADGCCCDNGLFESCYPGCDCKRPGEITFKPGLRLQPRYNYFNDNDNNDFFINRFRMKASGNVYDVGFYGAELKTDISERLDARVPAGHNPTPVVENAWVCFNVVDELAYLRVGLYDIPFSRNALTSDSKLLFMDRTLVKDALTRIGMADNTVGVMLHGRPAGGYLEYAIGIFDDIAFDTTGVRETDQLMPAGRIAWYLLEPAQSGSSTPTYNGYADYKESYLGQGQRLVLGANFATVNNVNAPGTQFDTHAWGVDLFYNFGRFVFQWEYDWFTENFITTPDLAGEGWYVQGGYILGNCWELAARYQQLNDPIFLTNGSSDVEWSQVGLNYYIHDHNLKVQMDYVWKNERGTEIDNDGFQVQLQLDF